jgi:hypothetical protein
VPALTFRVGKEALALEVRHVRAAVPRVRRSCVRPDRALSTVGYATSWPVELPGTPSRPPGQPTRPDGRRPGPGRWPG